MCAMSATRLIDREALDAMAERLFPGARVGSVARLGDDDGTDATTKGLGYGVPLKLTLVDRMGHERDYVLHTARPDAYGHDRRSDRAEEMLLAYDTFREIPQHSRAVDVGAVTAAGHMLSLAGTTEFYLLTEYAEGNVYADDLRRIAATGDITDTDVRRCEQLANYLADLHTTPQETSPQVYRRAVRDLVGDGEGIFGMIDGYPPTTPAAPPQRLQAIEQKCVQWRWRLKDRAERLALTHGDFHPFNILFTDADHLTLLDASRGCHGDPADDVACLAINYIFFAVDSPTSWPGALGVLWQRFWDVYLERTGDTELLDVAAPYLTWRALVLANPNWYPALTEDERDRLLAFAEAALDADRFSPSSAHAVFT
jgi:aminoglycoside phosphotransferase (APT) family kinase protein